MTRSAARAVALGLLLAASGAAEVRAEPAHARFTGEVTVGGGWRTSIDTYDRGPGFSALGGGGEVTVGVAWGGIALLGSGRARIGVLDASTYWEATGSLSFQFYLGESVRARIGADAGQLSVANLTAPMVGGFLSVGFETVRFFGGRFAGIFALRLDVNDILTDDNRFPGVSTALSAGVGFRY